MTIFFTADHHFSMPRILITCKRPFNSIEEHDEALIKLWNDIVKPDDKVYYLGDLTLKGARVANVIINRLHGQIHFLVDYDHHDKHWANINLYNYSRITFYDIPIMLKGFYEKPIILSHFPYTTWNRSHYGSLHFHGHSHGMLPKIPNRLDVGVDNAYKLLGEYRPFTLNEAIIFAKGE